MAAVHTQSERKASLALGCAGVVQLPIPSAATRAALSELGVVFGAKVDGVLLNARLPANWRILRWKRDVRHMVIVDAAEDRVRGTVFLKKTGYDYYGRLDTGEGAPLENPDEYEG